MCVDEARGMGPWLNVGEVLWGYGDMQLREASGATVAEAMQENAASSIVDMTWKQTW